MKASGKKLKKLTEFGAEVVYIQSDITKPEALKDLLNQAETRFGPLHGVIHGAGVIRDAFLWNKTTEQMDAVLAPKVTGTLLLDTMTRNQPLDFFVTFSSLAGSLGNLGQSDYAYANHFQDQFARWRSRPDSQAPGKSLSIGWSLWRDGGMAVDPQTEKLLATKVGIQPLDTQTGWQAFQWGTGPEPPALPQCPRSQRPLRGLFGRVFPHKNRH